MGKSTVIETLCLSILIVIPFISMLIVHHMTVFTYNLPAESAPVQLLEIS
jgi:hypothetical protein